MASYPGAVPAFTTKTDLVDTIHAQDVDGLQDEVIAIENTLGLNPQVSTTPNPAGTFNSVSTAFASLAARLANIETGIVADTHNQYIKSTGGSVVTTVNNGTVPFAVQEKSGQTADVFQVLSPSGSIKYLVVDSTGTVSSVGQVLPLGLVAIGKQTTNSTGLGSSEAMLGSLRCAFTAVSGRVYRVTMNVQVGDINNTATIASLRLRDGTTTSDPTLGVANAFSATINSAGFGGTGMHYSWILDTLAPGAHNLTPSVQPIGAGANFQVLAGAANPSVMWVEDVGS